MNYVEEHDFYSSIFEFTFTFMLKAKHDVFVGHLSIQGFVINCGADIFLITYI